MSALGGPVGEWQEVLDIDLRELALSSGKAVSDADQLEAQLCRSDGRQVVGALLLIADELQSGRDGAERGAQESLSGEVLSEGGASQSEVQRVPVRRWGAQDQLAPFDLLLDIQLFGFGLGVSASAFPAASASSSSLGQPSRSQRMNSKI